MSERPAVLSALPSHAFRQIVNKGKFAAKLDYGERAAILSAYTNGVRRELLAAAFSVDRRTIGHIVNPTSVHYKDVRKEMKEMGPDDFTRKYLTEDMAQKIGAAVTEQVQVEADPNAPDKKKNKMAGLHTVKPSQCAYSHRIEIEWRESPGIGSLDGPGWYYRDLDSKDADMWLHNGPDSLRSSNLALSYATENLMDD